MSRNSLLSSLFFVAFGLAVLAFLAAVEQPEWFRIRPASGTAAAMAYASDKAPPAGEPASVR